MKMIYRLFALAFAAALLVCPAMPSSAQSTGSGTITGTVTDSTGAVVPNATVVVTDTDTGISRTLTTGSTGTYEAPFLQPGNYEVVLGGGNFGKIDRKGLILTVGQTLTVDGALAVGATSAEVTVTGGSPILDPDKVEVSQTLDQHVIGNLPVNARNWDTFVLLTPNVVPDGGSGLISFHGISGLYNQNYVDGSNNNEMLFSEARGRASGAPYVYSLDSIQEFQAETSNYSAEFGQAAGGQVNAITKNGTNAIHGDLFYYLRYPALNALDPFSKWSALHNGGNPFLLTQPIHQQQQFGGSVGGPIIKDKLFYFLTYDGFRRVGKVLYYSTAVISPTATGSASSTSTISPTQCPAITTTQCNNAIAFLLQLAGYSSSGAPQAPPSRFSKENLFFPRLDYQLNAKNHVFANFNFVDFDSSNGYSPNPTYSNTSVTTNGPTSYHERFLVTNWTDTITSNAVNEVRFQWGKDLETAGANDSGPSVTLSSLEAYGMPNALPRLAEPDETRWQGTDVFNYTKGRHSFKFGGDLNIVHEIMINLFEGGGLYSYSNGATANFQAWAADAYQGQAGDTVAGAGTLYSSFTQVIDAINGPTAAAGGDNFYMHMYDGFAEDSWKLRPNLTVNLGLRYDLQLTPNPTHPNTSNALAAEYNSTIRNVADRIQPRIGLSWSPMAGTVVRAGYGLFSGLNQGSTYYNMEVENGVYQVTYTLGSSGVPKLATFPNVLYPLPTPDPPLASALIPSGSNQPIAQNPFPAAGAAPTAGLIPSFHGLSPNFVPPLSHEMDFSVEQQLPGKMSLQIGYVGTRATRLPIFTDGNLIGQTPHGLRTYTVTGYNGVVTSYTLPFYLASDRINTTVGSLDTGFSSANLWYNSLATTLRRPFANGLELILNETWAHSLDDDQVAGNGGTFFGGNPVLDPNNLKAEYGNGDLDMRNRFTGTFVYQSHMFPDSWAFKYVLNPFSFSGAYVAQTGMPIVALAVGYPGSSSSTSALAGDDGGATGGTVSSSSGAATAGRPFYIQRNSQFGPGLQDFDMRISRDIPIHEGIHMTVSAQAFNLANKRIVTGSTTTGSTEGVNNNYSTYSGPSASCTGAAPAGSTFGGCFTPYVSATAAFGTPAGTNNLLYGPRQLEMVAKLFF
jgi:hypothetical protein